MTRPHATLDDVAARAGVSRMTVSNVYGRPDVVAAPRPLTRLETVLDASGAVTSFATQFLSKHSPLPSSFKVTPEIVDEFKVFLSSRQIQPGIGEWSNEGVWVRNRLKEEIVTQGRGVAEGDEIEAENDPQVQAALKAMRELHLSAVSDQRSAN